MKIQPVLKYQRLIPAAIALLGGVVSGCNKQTLGGSVPNPNPPHDDASEQDNKGQINRDEKLPTEETDPKEQTEEMPQLLSGDVPVENLNLDN